MKIFNLSLSHWFSLVLMVGVMLFAQLLLAVGSLYHKVALVKHSGGLLVPDLDTVLTIIPAPLHHVVVGADVGVTRFSYEGGDGFPR